MRSLTEQLERLVEDGRVGTTHLSLYVALLQIRERHGVIGEVGNFGEVRAIRKTGYGGKVGDTGRFGICRREVMRLGKIQGRTTYYQCLRELHAWGHVEYVAERGKNGKCWVRIV